MEQITVEQLVWDEVNKDHIWTKHKLKSDEVEQAIYDLSRIANKLPNGRILLIGLTKREKLLSIIVSPKNKEQTIWYPVTARRSNRKERNLYNSGGEI